MRAFAVKELGQPGEVVELPDPQPAEGEVLVRITAASINPMDSFVASGGAAAWQETRTPLVPGIDGVGIIEQVAPGGNGFKVGDEVVVSANQKSYWGDGTFAELVAVPSSGVFHKPAGLSDEAAATLPLAGATALGVAEQIEAGPDMVIAVLGATGGVGSWFTQIAAQRGAAVVALVKPDNADYALELGATDVVDYTDADAIAQLSSRYPDGIDAIADFTGSEDLISALAAHTRDGAALVSIGGRVDPDKWATLGLNAAQGQKADLPRINGLLKSLASGKLRAPEVRVVPLEGAGQALAEVSQRRTRGKVVVTIG